MNRNVDTVQAIYKAFGEGNVAAILEHLSPDVQWEAWADHSAQRAGYDLLQPRPGREGAAEFLRVLGQNTLHEFRLLDLMAGDRQVASELFIDFTYARTGRRIRDEEMHLWSFGDDGKVTRFRHYCDTGKHLGAAGLALPA